MCDRNCKTVEHFRVYLRTILQIFKRLHLLVLDLNSNFEVSSNGSTFWVQWACLSLNFYALIRALSIYIFQKKSYAVEKITTTTSFLNLKKKNTTAKSSANLLSPERYRDDSWLQNWCLFLSFLSSENEKKILIGLNIK